MTIPDRPSLPSSTGEMLARTRRRAEQLRRRRLSALTAVVAAVAAAVIPLALINSGHHKRIQRVFSAPTSVTGAPPTGVTGAPPTGVTPPMTQPPPSQPPESTSAPTSVGTRPGSTVAPGTTSTPAVAVPQCTTSELKASLTNPNGAAGSVGYDLVFVNTGSSSCSLSGYPGVSFVGGGGAQVGAPALRDNVGSVGTVNLVPGHAARATVIEVDAHNYPPDACQLTNVNGLRVYPPGQTASLFVAQTTQACANRAHPGLQIRAVQAS